MFVFVFVFTRVKTTIQLITLIICPLQPISQVYCTSHRQLIHIVIQRLHHFLKLLFNSVAEYGMHGRERAGSLLLPDNSHHGGCLIGNSECRHRVCACISQLSFELGGSQCVRVRGRRCNLLRYWVPHAIGSFKAFGPGEDCIGSVCLPARTPEPPAPISVALDQVAWPVYATRTTPPVIALVVVPRGRDRPSGLVEGGYSCHCVCVCACACVRVLDTHCSRQVLGLIPMVFFDDPYGTGVGHLGVGC